MGRRSRGNRNRDNSIRDPLDDLDNETPVTRLSPSPGASARVIRQKTVLEDRRNWAPAFVEKARDTLGRPARLVHKNVSVKAAKQETGKIKRRISIDPWRTVPVFDDARKAIICAKRKIRREVLWALDRTKSGKGSRKRRNEYSDIQC